MFIICETFIFHFHSLAVWEHCYAMIISNAKLSTGVLWDKQCVYNRNCSSVFCSEDVGIYIIILLRSEPVFLSLLRIVVICSVIAHRIGPLFYVITEVLAFFSSSSFFFPPGGSSYFIYSFVHVFIHLATMNNAALNYV